MYRMLPLLLSLGGCAVLTGYQVSTSGGGVKPCRLVAADGWQPDQFDRLVRRTARGEVRLWVAQDIADQAGQTLIAVHAYADSGRATSMARPHVLRLDPASVSVAQGERHFAAQAQLRESPNMKRHWRCGGSYGAGQDITRCESAVLSFDTELSPQPGYTLRLGRIQIDDVWHPLPDIPFCYQPYETSIIPYRG